MMDRGTIYPRIISSPALIENLFASVKNFFVHRLVINGLMADWVVTYTGSAGGVQTKAAPQFNN